MRHFNGFNIVTIIAGLLCLGLAFGTNASAADKNPCSDDIAKFCKDIKPGNRAAIMDCLEKHESQLSGACKDYEAKMGGTRAEGMEAVRQIKMFRQACKADVAKFCRDLDPAQGGIEKCLNEHQKELSTPCRESIKALNEEKKKSK